MQRPSPPGQPSHNTPTPMQDPPLSDSLAGDAVPPNPPDNVVVSRSSHESAPNNQKETPKTAATSGGVPNLLLKLLEACAKHKRHHENDNHDGGEMGRTNSNLKKCQHDLQSLARVLPRMETSIALKDTHLDEYQRGVDRDGNVRERDNNNNNAMDEKSKARKRSRSRGGPYEEDDVKHLCALYRAIARGAFCPHAASFLFGGGNFAKEKVSDAETVKGVMPRVIQLMKYLVLDPVRTASLPLRLTARNGEPARNASSMSLEETSNMFYQEEDIGATIAALLNLMEDGQLRLSVVRDLINLANDLNTIDESNVLFDPSLSPSQGVDTPGGNDQSVKEGKIRVRVFMELSSLVYKQSVSGEGSSAFDNTMNISSRRSHLALQLGVWTALQHLVPLVHSNENGSAALFSMNDVGLLNALMASSRSILQQSSRQSLPEPLSSVWSYSCRDMKLHAVLLLRTKLVVVGMFVNIMGTDSGYMTCRATNSLRLPETSLFGDLALAPSVELGLIAVDTAKSQLQWCKSFSAERMAEEEESEMEEVVPRQLEWILSLLCSWNVSNLVISAVLFPDRASVSRDTIWMHASPYLADCIPFTVGSCSKFKEEETCLSRVIVRVIHTILMQDSPQGLANLLQKRCLVRGYFSQLLGLANCSHGAISSPAVSVVTKLLESDLVSRNADVLEKSNLVELACLNALTGIATTSYASDEHTSPSLRLGTKRRKLQSSHAQDNVGSICCDPTIFSAFVHAIQNALVKANMITSKAGNSREQQRSDGTPEVESLITNADVDSLCEVSGALRVLLSLCFIQGDVVVDDGSLIDVIQQLFGCFKFISGLLVHPMNRNGNLVHVEPKILRRVLSVMTDVGYHACKQPIAANTAIQSAKEAMSHCLVEALHLLREDQDRELDEDERVAERATSNVYCHEMCIRLCSVFGSDKTMSSDLCLCRLTNNANEGLAREMREFVFQDVVPLQTRCIFLATQYPILLDSKQHDTTMASIRHILSGTSSKSPLLVISSLVGLANLFISKTRKSGCCPSSARSLVLQLNAFNFKDLVLHHAQSNDPGIRSAAFIAMARLVKVFSAASLVASENVVDQDALQTSAASTYLWIELDPSINGMYHHIVDMLSLDGPCTFTATKDDQLHSVLTSPILTNDDTGLLDFSHMSGMHALAKYSYLQSTLALAPYSALASCNASDFVRDEQHYTMYDKVAEAHQSKNVSGLALAGIPSSIWILLAPFVIRDKSAREYATRGLALSMFYDGCKLLSAFFTSENELEIINSSKQVAKLASEGLFREIEYLLFRFVKLPPDMLIVSDYGGASASMDLPEVEELEMVVLLLQTLCNAAPLGSAVGVQVFQHSLLQLLRIWMASAGGNAFEVESDLVGASSISSIVFDGLNSIFKKQPTKDNHPQSMKHVYDIFPAILREFFLPSSKEKISPWTRYHLLIVFVETFVLPFSRTIGLPAYDFGSVHEINGFMKTVYPSAIASMIENEDIEALEMCAAFQMYLISESKKCDKEEKRTVQKRSVTEHFLGTRQIRNRSAFSRDLVPGVTLSGAMVSTNKLAENTKLLCWRSDVIEYILPRLLLKSDRSVLKFFADLCPPGVSLSSILCQKSQTVLKTLVWELGCDDPGEDRPEEMHSTSLAEDKPKRKDVHRALKMGYLIKEGHVIMSANEKSSGNESSAGSWIAANFMYLMVNIILYKWDARTEQEKLQTTKCLRYVCCCASVAMCL